MKKYLSVGFVSMLVLGGFLFINISKSFACSLGSTDPATIITSADATLNGTNSGCNADNYSFWVSLNPAFSITGTDPAVDGAFSTPAFGAVGSGVAFSASLTSAVGLPAVTPNTTYYFVAWTNVGGTWTHGAILSFKTLDNIIPTVGIITMTPSVLVGSTRFIGAKTTISAPVADEVGGSGIDATTCRYNILGGGGSSVTVPTAYDGTNCTFVDVDTTVTNMSMNIRVVDLAGNIGQGLWTSFSKDLIAPTITLTGAALINLNVGDVYTELGATATDAVDGTDVVTVGGDVVNTAVAGIYHVTYDAVDALGNHSIQTIRTVNVHFLAQGSGPLVEYIAPVQTPPAASLVVTSVPVVQGNNNSGNENSGQVLGVAKFTFTLFLKKGPPYNVKVKGNEVMELQKLLNAGGYNSGPVDGKFGPLTKAAVIKFQLANGLKGDGIIGDKTRAVLNK